MKLFALFLTVLFIVPVAFAHELQENIYVPNFFQALFIGLIFLLILTAVAIHYKDSSKNTKKTIFVLFVVLVISVTGYFIGGTIYLNIVSESGGLVHWHADFEVWACGEKLEIIESQGLEGKVGSNELHHHNDYRIHAEGVFIHLEDASVGEFFEKMGGEFDQNILTVPLKNGQTETWVNGELCPSGKPGIIKFYVNNERNYEFGDHIMAPYANVPPGDYLIIKFEVE